MPMLGCLNMVEIKQEQELCPKYSISFRFLYDTSSRHIGIGQSPLELHIHK